MAETTTSTQAKEGSGGGTGAGETRGQKETQILEPIFGSCLCGKVKFRAEGPILSSEICHCLACSRARSVGGVHLLIIRKEGLQVTEGGDNLKTGKGYGKMEHIFCKECGCSICQSPAGAPFRALFPRTFHRENTQVDASFHAKQTLPDYMKPTAHVNYESRLFDVHDSLPKFKGFVHDGIQLNNDGTIFQKS